MLLLIYFKSTWKKLHKLLLRRIIYFSYYNFPIRAVDQKLLDYQSMFGVFIKFLSHNTVTRNIITREEMIVHKSNKYFQIARFRMHLLFFESILILYFKIIPPPSKFFLPEVLKVIITLSPYLGWNTSPLSYVQHNLQHLLALD